MKCFNCNYESYSNFNFCPKCGCKANNNFYQYQNNQFNNRNYHSINSNNSSKYDVMAILSFVFSLFTTVLCCFNLLAIPGLILGAVSYKNTKYRGLAITGIIISIIALCLFVLFMFVVFILEMSPTDTSYYYEYGIDLAYKLKFISL